MPALRIYVDFQMSEEAFALLKEGTPAHQLLMPKKPASSVLSRAEPDPLFAEAEVAFGQPEPCMIAQAPKVRWVHISSSGITRYENPEFRAMVSSRGIPVTNSASVYDNACAVHALSFMLANARHLPRSLSARHANGTPEWHKLRGDSETMEGETVLIVGYGAIGRRLAELLSPFHMKVLAFRRKPRGDEAVPVIASGDLPEALRSADHVMNILPDSPATRRYFDRERFSQMKQGAVFYNIGRGTTVDQEALLDALRSRRLSAAWLDVTDPEPLPDGHPLCVEPDCHITPHVAGGHTGESCTLVRHFLANLKRFERSEELLDRVM